MDAITIRRAEASDAARLNAALRRLSDDIGDPHGATDEMLVRAGFGDYPVFHALLAEANGETVGVALYSPVFSTVRASPGVYVSDLWVSDTVRGKGLGRKLLKAVATDAGRAWGAGFLKLAVYHDNDEAQAFYHRLGFTPVDDESIMSLDADGFAALRNSQEAKP